MKNNKLFVFLMSFVFALVLPFVFTASSQTAFAGEEDFVLIENYQSLKQAFMQTNAFEKNYKLTNNIDLTEETDFLPFGLSLQNETETITSFSGIFDGNGYSIVGLNFDNTKTYYTYGLFAKLENAQVRNLILDNITIENENAFSLETLNNQTILAGGIAGTSEASLIENVFIKFAPQSLTLSGIRVDFGGVVARAYYGTTIKNVKVSANFDFNVQTEKLQTLNVGLIAGEVYNSYIHNVVSSGSIKVAKESTVQSQVTTHNLGALAGSVERANSLIKATYSNIVFETIDLDSQKVNKGALVGYIKESDSPNQTNLSHNVLIAKTKVGNDLTDYSQTFGKAQNYNLQDSVYNYLTKDNYSIFEQDSYWTGLLDSYKWNTKTIWKLTANTLPVLQMFDEYEVSLNIDKTRVSLSSSILPQDLLVMQFKDEYSLEQKNIKKDFRYGDQDGDHVTILIALINQFDIYYKLQSVEINGSTVINKLGTSGNYALSQVEIPVQEEDEEILLPYDNLNSTRIYLFSFDVSNFDSGEISVTLEKVAFELTVETQNPDEGKVRRREAQTPNNTLTQTLYVGTLYEFVAVPVNNSFALDRWVMEFVDEITLEPYYIELEDYGKLSNIAFEFGKADSSGVTENFLNGGKLVAIFSSNITKITFMVEEGDKGENKNAGQIFDGNETEEFLSSTETSFIKGRTLTFVAKEKDGYTFVGWYDNQNRLRERNQILTYETNHEEDEITLIAVYEKVEGFGSLTTLWIVLGSVAGVAVLAVVFVIIKRKRSDMSYRNFY